MNIDNIFWLVFDIFINLYQSFIIVYYLFESLECKYLKKEKKCFFVLSVIVFDVTISIMNMISEFENFGIFVYVIILLIISVLFLKGSFIIKAFTSFTAVAVTAISTMCVLVFTSYIANMELNRLVAAQNEFKILSTVIAQLMITYVLLFFLNFTRKNTIRLNRFEWLLLGSVSVITITIALLLGLVAMNESFEMNRLWILLSLLGLLIINIVSDILIVRLSKNNAAILENSLLKQQVTLQSDSAKEVAEKYDEISKMRHDMKNNLNVIKILAYDGKYDEINHYVSEMVKRLDNTKKYITTQNSFIDAALNSKLGLAYKSNINVALNISDVNDSINAMDMNTLINNLFDNAIEGCLKCKGDRRMYFELIYGKNDVSLLIKNTVPAPVLDENPNLETRKKDKIYHGFGTKIIKEMVCKYKGILDYYDEKDMFCCSIILYLNQ